MQTQCPHCDTQFRITEEQYQIADGLVRCGVCNKTFNAFEVNQTNAPLPAEQNIQPIADTPVEKDDEENKETAQETPLASTATTFDESLNDSFTTSPISSTDEEAPLSFKNDNHEETKSSPDNNFSDRHSGQHEAEFDLFQTDDDETSSSASKHSIVPEKYTTEHSHSVLKGVVWSIAIVFLVFTLALEYIWFNRNQLIQIPQAKPWVERLCQFTNCEMAALRDPAQIELVTRNIYSHPNQKNTLIVAVTLVNHANFAQPYPLMQIDFSDIRGNVVAARRFKPQTYLHIPKQQIRPLAPETSNSFTMMIQDPGKQAMTYEFNFL